MNIPVYTVVKFVKEDGFLTDAMQDYNDLLTQELRKGLSNNGWTVPQITAANLATIAPDMPDGTIWYETDNKEYVGKVNGSLMKFTMATYP
jgi:hypothetical protein